MRRDAPQRKVVVVNNGPAGLQYNVTPHDLADATVACASTAEAVKRQLETLQRYVQDLHNTSWHGTASDNFTGLMADYDRYADQLYWALHAISEGLGRSEARYTDAEASATRNVSNIQIPPPARLD